jgi:hypothetical protein
MHPGLWECFQDQRLISPYTARSYRMLASVSRSSWSWSPEALVVRYRGDQELGQGWPTRCGMSGRRGVTPSTRTPGRALLQDDHRRNACVRCSICVLCEEQVPIRGS